MKEKTEKVYHCEFCKKISLGKGAMANHEKHCRNNPANIPLCWNCENYKRTDEVEKMTYMHPIYDEWTNMRFNVYKCKHSGKNMFWRFTGEVAKKLENKPEWQHCPSCKDTCKGFKPTLWAKTIKPLAINKEIFNN